MDIKLVENFLEPLVLVYSIVMLYIMDMALIESRFSRRVYYGIATAGMIVSCGTLIVLYRIGGLAMMQSYGLFVGMLPSCALFYFLSKHRGSRLFLAFCTADIAGIAMMMLSMTISIFFGENLLAALLTQVILITLMTIFIVTRVAKPFCNVMNAVQKGWSAAAIITLQFYLLLYGYFLYPTAIENRPEYVPVGIMLLVLLFSCYWFIYKTISWLNEIHLAEKTEQGLRLQLALQKKQYSTIQEKVERDKIFRHDLRHHAKLLAEMLSKNNVEEALAYLQKLSSYALETGTIIYCENMVVNAVLCSQLVAAKQLGIKVTCKAVLPAVVEIDEMELCVVLSNLLENAIEHCSSNGTDTAILDISIKKNKGQIYIRIQNSFDGEIRQRENGEYLSLKQQGGIGLKSVAAIVTKYNGAMNITHTKTHFTVDVAL